MDTQVLIAGAGPTGLVLAIDLARRGVAYRLIDGAAEHFTGSRGKGLQPRTLEVLDDLGVLDRLRAEAGEYPPVRRYAGTTVVWEGRMDELSEPTEEVPYPNILMLPQARTEALLRDRLAELGGEVELGVALADFEQDENGVTATLTTSAGTERVRAAWLVGADGGHSTVRKRLGVGFEGETLEHERFLIADLRIPGLDLAYWHTFGSAEAPDEWLALCPLAGTDHFQLVAPIAAGAEVDAARAGVQSIVDKRAGWDLAIEEPTWISLFRPNIRMVDRFRVGRVFLAGDAAHVHSPAGGQGLNTSIQDAYNLAWKLAIGSDGLLDTYEEERLPVAADVLGISTRLHTTRNQRRGKETRQLGISYRGTTLAADAGDGALEAGDRAPDGLRHNASGDPVRLFDLFRGPHFTLLATEPVELADESVRVHVVDRTYAGARFALVRPDGYLGMLADDPATVVDYLAAITGRASVAG